jgi:hypothetical protein
MLLERFVEKWGHRDYPPEWVSELELGRAEWRLRASLPDDYRSAVLQVGLPCPGIELFDTIEEGGLDLDCPNEFLSPADMVETSLGWRMHNLPRHLVAFAIEDDGSLFCFDGRGARPGEEQCAGVFLFDVYGRIVEKIAPSFDAWLLPYCELEPYRNPPSATRPEPRRPLPVR